MTGVVLFLIDFIVSVFNLMLSFKFELFGVQVSLLSLELAVIVMCIFIGFFRNETGTIHIGLHRFTRAENRKDKNYVPKHGRDVYEPRHSKEKTYVMDKYVPKHGKE